MTRLERFGGLLAYETWATNLAMGSIESVPPERRSHPQFARALRIASHIQVARHVWLERLHGRPAGAGIDFFPAWDAPRVRREGVELDGRWSGFLGRQREQDLDSEIHYTSSEGARYAGRVEDILTHVINHATYHRGQIASLVTECGGLRATTDFIGYTRRTV